MGDPVKMLSPEDIRKAFEALAAELTDLSEPAELFLVGGGALALLYDARQTTKDVDVMVLTASHKMTVLKAAARVAENLGLPESWLNEGAKAYIRNLSSGSIVFDSPSLIIKASSPEQLLAMKIFAWRDDVDYDDAKLLLSKIHGTKEQVWAKLAPYLVPGNDLAVQYRFDDAWELAHGSH